MSDEISLFSLMDSHLSKTRLSEISIENHGNNPARSASDVLLPNPSGPRLGIPNFFPGSSPMKNFLAEQISNTLKAKEKLKQEEEEQRKIEEDMKKLKIREKEQLSTVDGIAKMKVQDEQEYIIDLTPAIIQQSKRNTTENNIQPHISKETSTKVARPKSGQVKTLIDPPLRWDKETCQYKPWDPNLPCTTDISYILKQKIKRGKCSSFGKVLCSRLRPIRHISIPYETEKFESNVVRFNFKTKSPGDICRENQRKPKMSTRWTMDITDYV